MIQIKNNTVNLDNVHYKIYTAIGIVGEIYEDHDTELVLTSVRDSKHRVHNSLHYDGKAFDCRIWNLPKSVHLIKFTGLMQSTLGDEYDVVLEKDHIHIEYDPE